MTETRGKRILLGALLAVASFVAFFAIPAHTDAAINPQINFQGKLTNPDGTNVTDGTYSITFSIYTVSTGGTAVWTETQSSVAVSSGIFQVSLGSVTALPGSVNFATSALYLGVKVGSDAEMTPRIQFTAAPYAFNASTADNATQLGGIGSSGYVQLSPGSQQTGNINISGSVSAGSSLAFTAASSASIQSASSQSLNITGNAASTFSTSAGQLTLQSGSGTISLGTTTTLTSTGNMTFSSGGSMSIVSATTNAVSLDSGTTGAVNIGTGSNAKAITIGNTTSGTTITQKVGAGTTAFSIQGTSATYLAVDATNSRVYIGGSTAVTSPTLLILGLKSTTGDPTGVNGGEYYNSVNNKFRCYQNSIWMDCGNGFNTVTKTADQAATQNSTTFQNDNTLSFAVNANTTYVFDAWIPVNDSNTGADLKYTFTAPTSSTLLIMTSYSTSGTPSTGQTICNITASAQSCANTAVNLTNHFIQVRGYVGVAGTAGTVQFQFAQSTSTGASFPVIKKGATLTWHQSN
jgi:hypothetical protein